MSSGALFLDRDGVINQNHVYLYKCENFDFIYGIFDLARCAHEKNISLLSSLTKQELVVAIFRNISFLSLRNGCTSAY